MVVQFLGELLLPLVLELLAEADRFVYGFLSALAMASVRDLYAA